jgi:hypothetical protein
MQAIRVSVALLLATASLCGQVATGRITGRVTDSSGSIVPGASVKGVNILTNVTTTTVTTSDGVFTLLNLIPGQYRLEVDMSGFKRFSQGPLELRVGDTLNLTVALQVGAQSESVTVNAEAPLLESASAATGQVVDSKRLETLPLPASNPLVTTLLANNMTMLTSPTSTFTPDANTQVTNTAAVGTRSGQTVQAIDGMPSMQGGGATGIVPPPEILQEVKVSTAPYDASIGHFTGATVNMVTKSGTNGFHGSLVFWNTNTSLNALSYFSKQSINNPATGPVTKDKIRGIVPYISFNRYRGTGGGPLVIPKVYNGRNKTFWQYAGDYFFMPYSTNGLFTVPSARARSGDFSDLLALGSAYQIYDPYSATLGADGRITRRPVPNNVIPSNQLSPVAQKLLRYWPLPNLPGTNNGLQNYTGAPNSSIDMAQHFGRVDQTISDNNHAFVSYNRYCLYALQNITFGKPLGDVYSTGVIQANCHQGATVDEVYTPAPSWVLHVSYGLVRFLSRQPSTSQGFDLNSLGMSPALISQVDPALATLPAISITNLTGIGGTSGAKNSQLYHNLFASATHLRGAHNLRFGMEFRTTAINRINYGNLTPTYTFAHNWVAATDTSAAAPNGQQLASFLYGLPTSGSIRRNDSSAALSKMFAWYVQDDWKLSPKLTLNIGLRHELEFGETERYNRANAGFDFTTSSPVQATAQAKYAANPIPQIPVGAFRVVGGQLFASSGNRALYKLRPRNFMPRIGLAYLLTPNTVVRAGYGIYYESFAADFVAVTQNGYSQSTTMVPSVDNGLTFQATLQNHPFPDGILQPTGAAGGLNTFLGRSISFFDPNNRQGYAQRWSFNVQRQFAQRVLVEVGYIGNRGTHLGVQNNWGNLPDRYLSRSPFRDQATINALAAMVPNPFYGIPQFATTALANPTVAVSQLVTPYPQFTGVTSTDGSGFSWYHSLAVRAEKRFSHGLTLQLNYTWSKFMEATSRLNGVESPLEHVVSTQDRPQQFSPNGIYELPFGKGRRFLSSAPPWANVLAGGWQVQAIYVAQSGSPMAFGNVLFLGNLHDIVLPKSERTINRYFNTSAGFNTVAAQQLDRNYRTFPSQLTGARNPGWNLWAMSVIKNTRIHETVNFEIRAEAKNALNHPNFGGPSLNPTNALFGTISSAQASRQITVQGKLIW